MESLRQPGVQKWNWDTFVARKWNSNYSKIVYRKLNLYSPTENVTSREELTKLALRIVVQVIGSDFRFGYDKLVHSNSLSESDPNAPIDKNQGFFCSELVALFYKKLGLLPDDKAAT